MNPVLTIIGAIVLIVLSTVGVATIYLLVRIGWDQLKDERRAGQKAEVDKLARTWTR